VSRATVGVKQSAGLDGGVGAISMLASASAEENLEHGRVICLMNMVTSDELINDEEYEGTTILFSFPRSHH
jgi:splicing factor U2AF subunit